MTAALHTTFAEALAGLVPEQPLEVLARLRGAVVLYRNPDGVTEREAMDAIASGRPAYWTTAGYSSQRACGLVYSINHGDTIADALAEHYPARLNLRPKRVGALDTLVPLNRLASNELSEAYEEFGLWRDATELERRRSRDCRLSFHRNSGRK